MQVGDVNPNGQPLVRKTDRQSNLDPTAKVWVMLCGVCKQGYGCNSAVAAVRSCPCCNLLITPGEPV